MPIVLTLILFDHHQLSLQRDMLRQLLSLHFRQCKSRLVGAPSLAFQIIIDAFSSCDSLLFP